LINPTVDAVGYSLSPLCGWGGRSPTPDFPRVGYNWLPRK
jgi:hypothetical protein